MQKFNNEFKTNAVKLVLEKGNIKQISEDLGIGKSTLSKWIASYKKGNLENSGKTTEQKELQRLKRENHILKQERDILKKAMGIFSSRTTGNLNS